MKSLFIFSESWFLPILRKNCTEKSNSSRTFETNFDFKRDWLWRCKKSVLNGTTKFIKKVLLYNEQQAFKIYYLQCYKVRIFDLFLWTTLWISIEIFQFLISKGISCMWMSWHDCQFIFGDTINKTQKMKKTPGMKIHHHLTEKKKKEKKKIEK